MDKEVKTCPKCKKEIIINPYYPEWCDNCDWNINPNLSKDEMSVFEKIQYFLGNKFALSLFNNILKRGKNISRITIPRIIAYIIATIIYLSSLLFIYTAILAWKVHFLWGIVLLAIAYFFLPKFSRIKELPLSENQYPTLYKIVNEIALKLNSKEIDALYVDLNYNALFTRGIINNGFKMKRIICIGLPLFYILEPQEKVALLAHEISHNVNSDYTRGVFIGTAKNTLAQWYSFLTPHIEYGGYALLARIFFIIPRYFILGLWYALTFLIFSDCQTSEYHADRLAAEVSGSEAYISMLNKLNYSYQFNFMEKRMGLNGLGGFLERFSFRINNMPQKEIERVRRLGDSKTARLDATHPPNYYRINYIKSLDFPNPLYKIEQNDIEKTNHELGV